MLRPAVRGLAVLRAAAALQERDEPQLRTLAELNVSLCYSEEALPAMLGMLTGREASRGQLVQTLPVPWPGLNCFSRGSGWLGLGTCASKHAVLTLEARRCVSCPNP